MSEWKQQLLMCLCPDWGAHGGHWHGEPVRSRLQLITYRRFVGETSHMTGVQGDIISAVTKTEDHLRTSSGTFGLSLMSVDQLMKIWLMPNSDVQTCRKSDQNQIESDQLIRCGRRCGRHTGPSPRRTESSLKMFCAWTERSVCVRTGSEGHLSLLSCGSGLDRVNMWRTDSNLQSSHAGNSLISVSLWFYPSNCWRSSPSHQDNKTDVWSKSWFLFSLTLAETHRCSTKEKKKKIQLTIDT